jgi:hypothetical protein
MPTPAHQRLLDAALGLIRQKGIGRVTIALCGGALICAYIERR